MQFNYSINMTRVISFFLALVLLGYANSTLAITNTNSLDLEKSSSQYAKISDGDQTGLDLTSDFTLEAWVKLESLPDLGTTMTLFDKVPSSGGYRLNIGAGADKLSRLHLYYWDSSGNDTQILSKYDVFNEHDLGKWVHIAVSVDVSAKTAKMYKDGTELTTVQFTSGAGSVSGGSNSLSIGAVNVDTTATYFVDGLIDEARIWSDIRSQSEIEDNMHADILGSTTNLEGYWQFNQDDDDKTSNNNDLTLVNTPAYSEDPAHSLMCSISGLY